MLRGVSPLVGIDRLFVQLHAVFDLLVVLHEYLYWTIIIMPKGSHYSLYLRLTSSTLCFV